MFYTINISDHHKKIKDIHVRMANNKWQFINSGNGEASIKTVIVMTVFTIFTSFLLIIALFNFGLLIKHFSSEGFTTK